MRNGTAYLRKRRQGWYFRIRVPDDLIPQIGKREIVKSLHTRDLGEAQRKRWDCVAETTAWFERLRQASVNSQTHNPAVAREAFRRELEAWRSTPQEDWNPEYPLEMALVDQLHDLPEGTPAYDAARVIWQERAGQAPPVKIPTRYQLRFGEAAASYIAELRRDPNARATEQTLGQSKAVFRLFGSYANDPRLSEVTREVATRFLDDVARLSPLWGRSPKTKAMSWREIETKFADKGEGLSNRTLNRYSSSLAGLYRWAEQRGHWSGRENPFHGQHRKEATSRRTGWLPFEDGEVLDILEHCAGLPATDPMRWIPMIGAYSGMRSGEICSLSARDVRQEDGLVYLDITAAKTEAGIRRVPIHSEVLKAGFMGYVEGLPHSGVARLQDGLLFPTLKPGGPDGKLNWYFTKQFGRLREKLGITRERVGFHSFRKAVGTKLERARIPESEAVQILGHEKLSMSYTVYSLGVGLERLQEIVEGIRYR